MYPRLSFIASIRHVNTGVMVIYAAFFEYSDTKGKHTIGRHFHKSLLSSSSSQWSSRPGCAEGAVALWCLLLLLQCHLPRYMGLHNEVMLCRVECAE